MVTVIMHGSLLITVEMQMETYRYPTDSQLNVILTL